MERAPQHQRLGLVGQDFFDPRQLTGVDLMLDAFYVDSVHVVPPDVERPIVVLIDGNRGLRLLLLLRSLGLQINRHLTAFLDADVPRSWHLEAGMPRLGILQQLSILPLQLIILLPLLLRRTVAAATEDRGREPVVLVVVARAAKVAVPERGVLGP